MLLKIKGSMALGNPKKRKSLSPALKDASGKKKKPKMDDSFSPSKKKSSCAQDIKGCAIFIKLIESGVVADHEAVFYLRKKDKSVMKEGAITRDGVLCRCCNRVFLLSRFEVHAGSTLHRPSANMFLRDGRSLVECQQAADGGWGTRAERSSCIADGSRDMVTQASSCIADGSMGMVTPASSCKSPISRSSLESSVSQADDTNDNICQLCGDGGNLILCDSCPSAFHADCLFLDGVPYGEWHCPRCRCGACGGSISRASPRSEVWATPNGKEKSPRDRSEVSFDPSCESSIDTEGWQQEGGKVWATASCAQCRVCYHHDCAKWTSQEEFEGHWFCTQHCKNVFSKLRKLVGHVFPLDGGLSWMLIRSFKEDKGSMPKSSSYTGFEKKLSNACKVMQQSFDPIIDYKTGVDLLVQTLFNKKSDLRRLDCSGFYAMLLMKGEKLVSVATVRVHGRKMAELPFIATRHAFRQQGMCKTLMQALESMLQDVGVYKLILPSIEELVEAWRGPFGFKVMNEQERKHVSCLDLLAFPGTTLLHKSLLRSEATRFADPISSSNQAKGKLGLIIKLKLPPASKPISSIPSISCH